MNDVDAGRVVAGGGHSTNQSANQSANHSANHSADHSAGRTGPAGSGPRVDTAFAAHTAGVLLEHALLLADAAAPLLSDLDLDPRALGGLADAAALLLAHQACVDDVTALVDGLGQSLENDADRLYQVAFAAEAADLAAQTRFSPGGGTDPTAPDPAAPDTCGAGAWDPGGSGG